MPNLRKILFLVLALVLTLAFVACDNDEESESSSSPVSESETETQKPENAVTVKFDTQGAGEIDDAVIEKGEKVSKPSDPEKFGYTFDGWYVENEKWSFVGYVVTEDMTLTAKWIPIEYTITFEGAVLNPDIKYTIEDSVTLPEVIAKTGYTFEGWFEDKDFTKPISKIEKGTYGDKTIYGASICVGLEFTLVNDEYSVTGYDGVATDVIIPSFYKGKSVTTIGSNAFSGCKSLTSVTIPDSVTSIGGWAFHGCSWLTSVTIGDSVTSIGGYAFYDCTSLTSVTIPDSVTLIGGYAFYGCTSLASVTIGDSVTSIGDRAFLGCTSLTSITIPDSVTSIGNWAFLNCKSLTSVTIGDSVTSIGEDAFSGTSLTSVTIPNSVTSIGEYAFSSCELLTSVEVDENNTAYKSIDGNLYSKDGKTLIQYAIGKTDTSFVIPNSVTSIGEYAFSGCTSLTSVTIPNSVTSIGREAFRGCTSLTIYCEATSKPSGWYSSWNSSNRPVYWYSESEPSTSGYFWHYGTNGEIVIWE